MLPFFISETVSINRRMGGLESLDKIQGKARHINRRMGGLEN